MHAQIYACIFIAYFTGLLPASYLFCGSPQYLHYEPYITQPRPVHFIPHVVHHPCIPSLTLSVDVLPETGDVAAMTRTMEEHEGIHYLKILARE